MSEDGSEEQVTSLSAVDLNQAVGGMLKLLQKIPESQRHLVIRTVCELSGYSVPIGVGVDWCGTPRSRPVMTALLGGVGCDTVQKSGVFDGGGKTDQAG